MKGIIGLAVLLVLYAASPARAQEVPRGCAGVERASDGSGPVIALASSLSHGEEGLDRADPGDVVGCGFEPGERVRLAGRVRTGDLDFAAIDPVEVRADDGGQFTATLNITELDYRAGYEIRVAAEGEEGSRAETGIAGIASGGLPAPGVPATGGGATGTPPAASMVAAALMLGGACALRRRRSARY